MAFSVLYEIGEYFYIVLLAYLGLYLWYFAWPLAKYIWGGTFSEDVDRLESLIRKAEQEGIPTGAGLSEKQEETDSVEKVEKEELAEEIQSAHNDLLQARQKLADLEDEGDESAAEDLRTRIIPKLESHHEELNQRMEALEEEGREEGSPDIDPDETTARLENLRLLNADYRHPFASDAVSYLRAKFPRAEYQHFEVEPLPSVSEYLERVSMARNMAGAFVLLGLLGTMIKLDGVVEQIAGLAQTSRMQPAEFLGQMGTLMQGVKGAFLNSILGVALGVFALVIVGILNRFVQRRIDRLDHVMSQKVLPGLARVHNQLMPERTLADLLRGTGRRIDQLDETVEMLQSRMSGTVGTLSEEIEGMLERFEHYEKHYDLINRQVKALDERSESLESQSEDLRKQTEELRKAGERISGPIDDMNDTLRKHLEKVSELKEDEYLQDLLEDINEALEQEREEREEQLQNILDSNRQEQEQLLNTLKESLREENQTREGHVEDLLRQNADLREKILEQQEAIRETLNSQHDRVAQRLEETADALQASSPEQLNRMLQEMNEATNRLNQSSETLSETAVGVSDRIDHSAKAMEQAAQSLNRVAQAPTLFAWLTRTAWPTVKSGFYSTVGKDDRARRIERQIPSNGYENGVPSDAENNTTNKTGAGTRASHEKPTGS